VPKPRIYLDTSVISHLFHEDAPESQAATVELFENAIAPRVYDVFISGLVVDELRRTNDAERRKALLDVIPRYGLTLLPEGTEEIDRLAQCYMDHGIIPADKIEDALHVAYATVFEMDILVTWNYRHLAKVKTATLIALVNSAEGYARPLRLLTPLEVLAP
jgi:predicted nucleic acid-binding protein